MMNSGLKIPIFFLNEITEAKKDTGIKYKIEENDTRDIIFYHIDALATYKEDNREYASIHTNGTEYISPLSFSELEIIIDEHLRKDVFFLKS